MHILVNGRKEHYRTIEFDAQSNKVRLIEQRLLPHKFEIFATDSYTETARAITDMVVRGAGAIGATAAYGLAQGANEFRGKSLPQFRKHFAKVYETLKNARPTAVDP